MTSRVSNPGFTLHLACAALLLSATGVEAQTVRGRVVGDLDGRLIAQAHVAVLAADGDAEVASRVSSDGNFLFDLPAPGAHRLRVRALGYRTLVTTPVDVSGNTLVTVELRLRPDAVALEPLRVVAERIEPPFMRDVRRRQQMGFGRLLTREELDERFGSRLDDVLRDAGMRIEYVPLGQQLVPLVTGRQATRRIVSGDACYSALYLNGIRQFPSTTNPTGFDEDALENVLQLFEHRPQDIEAIEIYRSRAQAPAEWANPMSDCGVVAIWLRGGYEPAIAEAPYTGPWPVVSLNVAGSTYRLTGGQAPGVGTAVEAATYWRLSDRISVGARVRRSVHVLQGETTAELMRGTNPRYFDPVPGPRPLSLFVMAAEPRFALLPQSRITPAATLRLQLARRGFAVDDTYHPKRSYSFSSLGMGLGAAAGLSLRVGGAVGLEASAAHDRLFFNGYAQLDSATRRTSTTWRATSLRLGITTLL